MDPPIQDGWMKTSTEFDPASLKKISRRQSIPGGTQITVISAPPRRKSTPHTPQIPHSLSDTPLHSHHDTPMSAFNRINRRCSGPGDPYNVEYPRAVDELGIGKFHIRLALTCGFMFMAAGLQNNLNAYILSSVHCDLQISSSQMGLLNAVFLAGGISSNFLWGVIADLLGRRSVVVYGMFVDGVLTLMSSLSQHYVVLLVFRFLNGFIVGGPSSLVFAYMGEFFPDKVRSTVICYVGIFWTLSWVFMPAMAWLVIPLPWSVSAGGFVFNSWRMLVALTAVPSLLSGALLLLFPESPRFMLVQGKVLEAVNILANIYSINKDKDPGEYPVRSLQEHRSACEDTCEDPKPVCKPVLVLVRQAQLLFAPSTVRITALASSMFFCNMFGYYGLGLWLPELFNRMSSQLDLDPQAQVTLCSASLDLPVNGSVEEGPCDPTAIDTDVFLKSVIMGVVGLSGNVISGVLSSRVQRHTLPVTLMGLSGLCVVIMYFTTSMLLNVVLASAFQLTVGTANLVYNSLVVDMFPPNISGMGVCVSILSGRLGGMISNLVFGSLLDVACSVPIFLVAGVLFAGSAISFLIPKRPYTESAPTPSFQKTKQDVFIIT